MTGFDTRLQAVHHLLERLDERGIFHIVLRQSRHRQADDFAFGIADRFQLFNGLFGEFQFFIAHFLHGFRDVDGMVGKPFQIADDMQQFGDL